jgi:nicotinamidase-related amidase
MSATSLDPRTALVVVDLQRGIANVPTVHPIAGVVANAARLARAFRDAQLPVVLVTVSFAPDGADRLRPRSEIPARSFATTPDSVQLVAELGPEPGDLLITKRHWGAFYGTELDLQLRRRQITGIVLSGVATSIGVDTTARGAYERGYNLTFAFDAMTDIDPAAHDFSLKKIFPRIGEVDSTEAVLGLLRQPT